MNKEKIAFVTIRYGKDINGGAEYHCRMLAERMAKDYDVEVLTTCVKNYHLATNELPEGTEQQEGVLVRRFKVNPIDREQHDAHLKALKAARKCRRLLFRLHGLGRLSTWHPVWHWKEREEIRAMKSYPFYSSALNDFVQMHRSEYKVFIPVNLVESPCFFTALHVPEKTILIPTLHDMGVFFWSIHSQIMTRVAYIAFNTKAEERFATRIFGRKMSPHGVVGVGIEEPDAADWQQTRTTYCLPESYVLYVGRIDPGKLQNLFEYFVAYKQSYPSSLKLVLVGGMPKQTRPFEHPDVLYTGFVSDEEKRAILQHAAVVVNPSLYESLSLIALEAMNDGKPLLVNGRCEVLKEHCLRSGGAAMYYMGQSDFVAKLQMLCESQTLHREMASKGKRYVQANYSWPLILKRLKEIIQKL